jgi:hypothetical protein
MNNLRKGDTKRVLLPLAINRLAALPTNTLFNAKDLFTAAEWHNISPLGYRRSLGRALYDARASLNVSFLGMTYDCEGSKVASYLKN